MSPMLVSFHQKEGASIAIWHIRAHETHAEERRDLDNSKEQQKQRFPHNAPPPHRTKILAETIDQGLSPHRQLS